DRYKTVLVPDSDGRKRQLPLEMKRTKPYGYSLFNLEAMSAICEILSAAQDNLWEFALPDGRIIRRAVAFMEPYIRHKKRWPLPPDVMYYNDWPMRQSSLLFAGLAYNLPG
ncbi:MAG: alginate lyase family protein, partial [bacterium]